MRWLLRFSACCVRSGQSAGAASRFNGDRAFAYTRDSSLPDRAGGQQGTRQGAGFPGKTVAKDELVKDSSPRPLPRTTGDDELHCQIPGSKDGVIVLASHYDTNYPLKDTAYVGANDGGQYGSAAGIGQ